MSPSGGLQNEANDQAAAVAWKPASVPKYNGSTIRGSTFSKPAVRPSEVSGAFCAGRAYSLGTTVFRFSILRADLESANPTKWRS